VPYYEKERFDKDQTAIKVAMPDGSQLYLETGYNEAEAAYVANRFWDQRWRRWATLLGIVALYAFIPCAALFVIGYALLWVGRGFTGG
jgi:hypothetical protein